MDISVVVPVYNVEKYVRKCIESLVNQTIGGYIVYLIDDGSTDNSGIICDEYSAKYSFIRTFHKTNGGLSDARNYGVIHAEGNYISFVDSDDTVRTDYIEKLSFALRESGADIAVANYIAVTEGYSDNSQLHDNTYSIEDNKSFLCSALMGEKGSLSAWGKLFRKDLLVKNPFPKGKLYEDMEIIFHIYNSVDKIAYVDQNLYFYLTREGSIVQSRVTEKHKYGIESCIHMLDLEDKSGGELSMYIKCRIVKQACGHLPNLVRYNDFDMFYEIALLTRFYIRQIMLSQIAPVKLKIRAAAYLFPPKIGLLYARIMFAAKRLSIK